MEKEIVDIVNNLIKPAGDARIFNSLDLIKQNYNQFISAVHKTWKQVHNNAIENILIFDSMERENKRRPLGQPFEYWVNYSRQIWRRVNDSIVWLIFHKKRHKVKRLCLYRNRSSLYFSNPDFSLAVLKELNSNPYSIALWNDTTSCVDVGDITVYNAQHAFHCFYELKEGEVNQGIFDLLQLQDEELFETRFSEFKNKYGKKGAKQFERFQRQEERDSNIIELIEKETGIDPYTGENISIVSIGSKQENYDRELNDVIELAKRNGEAIHVIEDCLWIYVNTQNITPESAGRNFRKLLLQRRPGLHRYLTPELPKWDLAKVSYLNSGDNLPTSMPIFIRGLSPENIASITFGNLRHKVLLFFDLEKFGSLLKLEGAEFYWSSEKEAKREKAKKWEQRSAPIFCGRIPQFSVDHIIGYITGANIIQVLFDGLKPSVLAKQLVEASQESLEILIKKNDNSKDS